MSVDFLSIDDGEMTGTLPQSLALPTGLRKFDGDLTIVCGPPGGGKTTYCARQKRNRDIVLDLDDIKGQLSGRQDLRHNKIWLKPALQERNRLLAEYSRKTDGAVFFIVCAPNANERLWWATRLGAKWVVMLETSVETCVLRNRVDSGAIRSPEETRQLAGAWWRHYTRRFEDIVLTA